MKHFSTCKKLINCLESRGEASTSPVLDETERPKVLITFFKQKFQKVSADLIKLLYNIRKSTATQG